LKYPNKKGISGNGPAPCIPPVTRRLRKTVSPRKRSSGPLDGGFQRMASCGSFILSRGSPDSVIPGPGPLMPEKRITPPLVVTISCVPARRKRGNAVKRGKNRLDTHFFRGGQICWSSFVSLRPIRGKKKNRTRKRSPDAAKCVFVFTRSVRAGPAHFGMRNCGIGICWPSYMFIYCAKSR